MKAPSEQQFIEVYRLYAPQIFKYCYFRVKRREDAEDIASQTFLKTWEYLAKGNTLDNLRAFLYRVAHNLIIDHYKGRGKQELQEVSIHNFEGDDMEIPAHDDIEERIEIQELVRKVKDGMDGIKEEYRDIIVLRYINDLSFSEIAQALNLSEVNVRVKLHRAVKKVKELFA